MYDVAVSYSTFLCGLDPKTISFRWVRHACPIAGECCQLQTHRVKTVLSTEATLSWWEWAHLLNLPPAAHNNNLIFMVCPFIVSQKAERTAEQTKDEVLRAKAMQELKSMEAERKAKTQEKLAKAAHMDPDGLQYFTKHYGYW